MKNTILLGDAMSLVASLPKNHIDLTVFSPPYDGIRDYGNNWSFDYKSLGESLFNATKEGGVCAMVIQDSTKNFAKSLTSFRLAVDWVDRIGWKMFECCIYSRNGRPGAWWNQRFRVDHEYIHIFFKGERPKTFDKSSLMVPNKSAGEKFHITQRLTSGETIPMKKEYISKETKCRGSIWQYHASTTERNKLKLEHPATFPDKLAGDLISCFSAPGDLVLDPMCGSGTTCVMAQRLGRDYLGIEINEPYHRIAVQQTSNLFTEPNAL